MPTVPTLDTERVGTAPLQLPQQRAVTTDLTPIAQGLSQAGSALEQARIQIGNINLSEADVEATRRLNARLYTDDDAYFKLNGRDAVEGQEQAMAELDRIAEDVSNRFLTTGTQRRVFRDALAPRLNQARAKMATHAFDQRQLWDRRVAVDGISNHMDSVVSDPSRENVTFAGVRIEEFAETIAGIDGLPSEQFVKESLSSMYRAAIESAATTDTEHANELLRGNDRAAGFAERLTATDRLEVQEALQQQTVVERSRRESERIRAVHSELDSQIEAAQKIRNTEVSDAVVNRLTRLDNIDRLAESQERAEAYNELFNAVTSGMSIEQVKTIFPDVWRRVLSPEQKNNLSAIATGSERDTNIGFWASLQQMPDDVFMRVDQGEAFLKLGESDFRDFVDRRADILNNRRNPKRTRLATAGQALAKFGVNVQDDDYPALLMEAQERLDERTLRKGRELDDAEIQQTIETLTLEVKVPQAANVFQNLIGFSPSQFGFQITIDEVPESFKQRVEKRRKTIGARPLSDNEIIELYIETQHRRQQEE